MAPRRALAALLPLALAACEGLEITSDADAGTDTDTDAPPIEVEEIGVRFSLEGESFYRMPWPSDYRVTDDGRLDMSDFPDPGSPLFQRYTQAIADNVRGFAIMPVVYVGLEGDPIPETTPTPADSLLADGPVQLVDVSDEGCGRRVPIEVRVNHEVDAYTDDNLLMAAPVPGFVLDPVTPYALVVLTTLGNPDGFGLTPAADVQAALADEHADADFDATFAPLRDCLPELGSFPQDVAVDIGYEGAEPGTRQDVALGFQVQVGAFDGDRADFERLGQLAH